MPVTLPSNVDRCLATLTPYDVASDLVVPPSIATNQSNRSKLVAGSLGVPRRPSPEASLYMHNQWHGHAEPRPDMPSMIQTFKL
jgi:hypothetical protein